MAHCPECQATINGEEDVEYVGLADHRDMATGFMSRLIACGNCGMIFGPEATATSK